MKDANTQGMRAGTVRAIELRAERYGLDWAKITQTIGIEWFLDRCTALQVPFERYVQLAEHVAQQTGNDVDIFEEFSGSDAEMLSLVDYTTLYAPTVEDSLRNWARYMRVFYRSFTTNLRRDRDWECIEYRSFQDVKPHRQFSYALAAATSSRVMALSEAIPSSIRVEVDAPAPVNSCKFLENHGSRFKFDCERIRVFIPASSLGDAPSGANANLFRLLERTAFQKHMPCEERCFGQIPEIINQHLKSGTLSIASVAANLNMSERSLQRSVAAQGTTFRKLVESTRKALAKHYLEETSLPLKEVTYLLGFSEISAFSRAVKSWFGQPPRVYRQFHSHSST